MQWGRNTVRRRGLVVMATAALAVVGGCGGSSGTATTTSEHRGTASTPATTPGVDALTYCTDHGGTTEARQAYFGTNNDQDQWVALGQPRTFCRFVAEDDSRIYVDVDTLASPTPSLAAAAYLAKLPLPPSPNVGANPAAVDCNDNLLGTSNYGTTVNGGGWVNVDDPTFTVVNMCVFADGSAIDEWGITYYSGGVVRGADLAPLFRFDTSAVAAMFPPAATPPSRTTAP